MVNTPTALGVVESSPYFDEPFMPPSPLTRLLAASMVIHEQEVILDAGSGCGALAITAAARGARLVYAVELNLQGVAETYRAARQLGMETRVLAILGDMLTLEKVPFSSIDVVVCNPPQLPAPAATRGTTGVGGAYAAGGNGRRFVDGMIEIAAGIFRGNPLGSRRLELVTTSVVGIDSTFSALRRAGFDYVVTGRARAEFRPAYYKVLDRLDPVTYTWDADRERAFEEVVAVSATYGG